MFECFSGQGRLSREFSWRLVRTCEVVEVVTYRSGTGDTKFFVGQGRAGFSTSLTQLSHVALLRAPELLSHNIHINISSGLYAKCSEEIF